MFIAVTLQKKSDVKLFSKSFKLTQISKDGVTFSLLELKKADGINSKKIKSLIGKSPTLLSKEVSEASIGGRNPVDETAYSQRVMQKGLKLFLLEKRFNKSIKSAALIDPHCKYQELADMLLKYFPIVRIVTNKEEWYQNYADAKRYDCGAAVIIEKDMGKLDKSCLCVSPLGILPPKLNFPDANIVSALPISAAKSVCIHSFRVETEKKYLDILPKGIDEHSFQAALFNYCGKRELANSPIVGFNINSAQKRLENAILI